MTISPLDDWIVGQTGITARTREALEKYQLDRAKETLRLAQEKSRFYRKHLAKIDVDSISGIKDFQNLPFTYPSDFQEDPLRFLCVPQSEVARIVTLTSTGTSGKEKRLYFTERDLDRTIEFFVYGMSCLTTPADRVLVLLPGPNYGSIGDLLQKALKRAGTECFVSGVIRDYEKAAEEIVSKNINCIVGIPIQVLMLSRLKSDIFRERITSVLLSTDYVPETVIRELRDRHGCRVFTHYGMTEMGYGGGVECDALDGYHLREADLLFEIIDPVSGSPLADGQWGEVVFSTLSREAMPLIRYRTGDLACFSETPCACGTFLKTMKRVRGRIENSISLGAGAYLSMAELDELILKFREVRDYSAAWLSGKLLKIELFIDRNEDFRCLEKEISESIHDYVFGKLGSSIDLQIFQASSTIPKILANSMAKRIINKV